MKVIKSSLIMISFSAFFLSCVDSTIENIGKESSGSTIEESADLKAVIEPEIEGTTPIPQYPISILFSEDVKNFDASDLILSHGTISGFTGSGRSYSFIINVVLTDALLLQIPRGVAVGSSGRVNAAVTHILVGFEPVAATALIADAPNDPSSNTSLNIDVLGDDLLSYRYKLGPAASTDCALAAGYSAPVDIVTNITDDFSGEADTTMTVCVIGITAHEQQDMDSATSYTWIKDTIAPVVSGLANDSSWTKSKTWSWTCNEDCAADFIIDASSGTAPAGSFSAVDEATKDDGEGTFYFHLRVRDTAGNMSAPVHYSARIDAVKPSSPGNLTVGPYSSSEEDSPSISWEASTDTSSGVEYYEYAIGEEAGGTDILGWTREDALTIVATDLSLQNGENYFVSVRAVDAVGNLSDSTTGGSWLVDATLPGAISNLALAGDGDLTVAPTMSWDAAIDSDSGIDYYELAIGTSAGATDILTWKNIGNVTDHQETISLSADVSYFASIRAVDRAGNRGAAVNSTSWLEEAPEVVNPCLGTPTVGQECEGGAFYLGSLSPGASSGSGTDYYMTTPGGCDASATPTCEGTDDLKKSWTGTSGWMIFMANMDNIYYTNTTTPDSRYGSYNTFELISSPLGYISADAAPRYCHEMVYGGYSDWYLPNRNEFNLFYTNKALIPGLDVTGTTYSTSTQAEGYWGHGHAWAQRLSDGLRTATGQGLQHLVRCVRRYNPDSTKPSPFDFLAREAGPSELVSSNIVQVVDFLGSLPVSISGSGNPEYRICSDNTCSSDPAWTATAGTVSANQYIQLRLTSNAALVSHAATLSVGTVNDIWTVTSLPCASDAEPGDVCLGGAIFLADRTLTTPSGCTAGSPTTCGGVDQHDFTHSVCTDMVFAGSSNWRLPSKDELNLFWQERANIAGLDQSSGIVYASGTIDMVPLPFPNQSITIPRRWVQSLYDGTQFYADQPNDPALFRCIRNF